MRNNITIAAGSEAMTGQTSSEFFMVIYLTINLQFQAYINLKIQHLTQ